MKKELIKKIIEAEHSIWDCGQNMTAKYELVTAHIFKDKFIDKYESFEEFYDSFDIKTLEEILEITVTFIKDNNI